MLRRNSIRDLLICLERIPRRYFGPKSSPPAELTQIGSISDTIRKALRGSICKYEENVASAQQRESRYQSIDDTIVQLFISQASVLMARIDRI
jgi:hypothetical protein